MDACPQCHLPRDESAWQCDGCGYTFRRDYAVVRTELQAELKTMRITFWATLVGGLALCGVVVGIGLYGFLYVSVPLALAIVGGIGHSAHRTSVLREHLRDLDRRHVPLPTATAQPPE